MYNIYMFMNFVFIWGLVNLFLAIYSILKIKRNKKGCDFIWWWAFPNGSFVWEDMLVFGLLHAGFAFLSLALGNEILWLVFFLIFWIVRSAGETLYFFLQQFIEPKHHPHNLDKHLGPIRKVFGNISQQKCFIMMQVLMQSILVVSIASLFYVLKYLI